MTTYVIQKVNVATGETVKTMPVLYPCPDQARDAAVVLNDQFSSHHRYVAEAKQQDVFQFVVQGEDKALAP